MTSIIETLLQSLPDVSEAYATNIRIPSQRLAELEFDLRERGDVFLPFNPHPALNGKRLIAVDGGRASNQLAGGDLVVIGATVGDGAKGDSAYAENPIAEAYATVVAHTSKVENELAGRIMSALELRILSRAETDYTIIDGAYLGNVSEVLFALLSDNETIIDTINSFNKDGHLEEAIQKILNPPKDNTSGIVSVSKSDSSFVYSKELLGNQHGLATLVSDRNLASYFLHPGEYLIPRQLETNPALLKTLNSKKNTYNPKSHHLLQNKTNLLEALDQGHLYTTYFKPSKWTKNDRSIKIEFTHYPQPNNHVTDHARHLIEIIDDDILNNNIMEPWSQYIADRRAKEVSIGMDIVRNHLLNSVENAQEAQGLLRGYRT